MEKQWDVYKHQVTDCKDRIKISLAKIDFLYFALEFLCTINQVFKNQHLQVFI